MKRVDLERTIRRRARRLGLDFEFVEGASHTRVFVGGKQSTIPRHREIKERLAVTILRQLGLEDT
jgi:mRNA interferase HicA